MGLQRTYPFISSPSDKVDKKLGEGTFGKVYRCKTLTPGLLFGVNKNTNEKKTQDSISYPEVAIKIIRSQRKYMISAFIEINTLLIMHYRQPYLAEYVFRMK